MNILFICTHNRCRSILSEAIFNHLAGNLPFKAYSAGSQPAGEVHPLTLRYLAEKGIPTDDLRSESWEEFETLRPEIVVTVCDSAAKETCPLWFGDGVQLHWPLPDPSKVEGSEEEVRESFYRVMATIEQRAREVFALPLGIDSSEQLNEKLSQLIAQGNK